MHDPTAPSSTSSNQPSSGADPAQAPSESPEAFDAPADTPDADPGLNYRTLAFAAAATGTVWAILFLYVIQSAFPQSPLRLPLQDKKTIQTLLPEGWAFFTRSPREPRYLLFSKQDGTWRNAGLAPFAQARYGYGVNREVRAQGVEYGLIRERITSKGWTKCEDAPTTCLKNVESIGSMVNPSPSPTLCGTVGIVLQKPVPFAWRSSADSITMPSSVAKINISCSHDS